MIVSFVRIRVLLVGTCIVSILQRMIWDSSCSNNEKNDLIETILKLKEQFKLSIILVEHDMKVIMSLCESIAVMNQGRLIAEGAREEIRTNTEVIEAYLGTSAI